MQDPERNKENVLAFLRTAFEDEQPDKALDLYVGDVYIQHSALAEDGKEGFLKHARRWRKSDGLDVNHKRIFAIDDFVILHAEIKADQPEGKVHLAVADFFRMDEDGRIVEHWDVIQNVPAEIQHDNGVV